MSVDHATLLEAIAASPLADHDAIEVVEGWLAMQPTHSGHIVAATSGDVKRITLYSAGPPEDFVPVVGGFLAEGGASESELSMLASAGEGLDASQVGSWLELSDQGVDAGWYFPVNMPFAKARNFAPANPVNDALTQWARRSAIQDCAQLRRSVDPDQPAGELTIVIPGDDAGHELALVQQGFKSVGAPWFNREVDAAIKRAGSVDLLLCVVVGKAGLNACGVLIPEPNEELLETVAKHATRYDLDAIDDFDATLDLDLPGMLGCFQYPWGLGMERFFPL